MKHGQSHAEGAHVFGKGVDGRLWANLACTPAPRPARPGSDLYAQAKLAVTTTRWTLLPYLAALLRTLWLRKTKCAGAKPGAQRGCAIDGGIDEIAIGVGRIEVKWAGSVHDRAVVVSAE